MKQIDRLFMTVFVGASVMNHKMNFIQFKGLDLKWDNAVIVTAAPESKKEEELEQPLTWDVIGAHGGPDDFCFGGFFPATVHWSNTINKVPPCCFGVGSVRWKYFVASKQSPLYSGGCFGFCSSGIGYPALLLYNNNFKNNLTDGIIWPNKNCKTWNVWSKWR